MSNQDLTAADAVRAWNHARQHLNDTLAHRTGQVLSGNPFWRQGLRDGLLGYTGRIGYAMTYDQREYDRSYALGVEARRMMQTQEDVR